MALGAPRVFRALYAFTQRVEAARLRFKRERWIEFEFNFRHVASPLSRQRAVAVVRQAPRSNLSSNGWCRSKDYPAAPEQVCDAHREYPIADVVAKIKA